MMSRLFFVCLAFLDFSSLFTCNALSINNLTVEQFHHGIQSDMFQVIVDVRSTEEWETGHIDGATHVADLALAGTSSEIANASALEGCEYCPIAVYCRSGSRASVAINYLATNGFMRLYNGLGVSQWTDEGYTLVNTSSITPDCAANASKSQQCKETLQQSSTTAPTTSPTSPETTAVPIIDLSTNQFYDGVMTDFFDVIVDVRSKAEWDSGHVPGATLVINLSQAGTSSEVTNATALSGCKECRIVAYCGSGARASVALEHLRANGFLRLYNGQGVSQWIAAGYPLEGSSSVEPQCLQMATSTNPFCLDQYNGSTPVLPGGSLSTSDSSESSSKPNRLGFPVLILLVCLLQVVAN